MNLLKFIKNSNSPLLKQILLFLRGLLYLGVKYKCPCCGWRLREFTYGGISLKVNHLGYCPRCNAKARHRRIWLFLKDKTNLFSDRLRLFHVSPVYSLSRNLKAMKNIKYIAGDLNNCPNMDMKMDLTNIAIKSNTLDAIICVHVMEHIIEDRKAFNEIFRVLRSGGWAAINMPTRLDQKTYEDPTITSPAERGRAFGETEHVRIYGYDVVERLEKCGFHVQVDLSKNVDQKTKERYGLREYENIFYCTKP